MADSYSLAVIVYDGLDTADQAFDAMRMAQKDRDLDIKEAAVLQKEDGKVKLSNKGFVGTGKGSVLGLIVGGLLGGPLAGLVIGGLIGFVRSGDRRRLRDTLEESLGSGQSALAVVVRDDHWQSVADATATFEGELVINQLSAAALETLETISQDEDLTRAKAETVEESD